MTSVNYYQANEEFGVADTYPSKKPDRWPALRNLLAAFGVFMLVVLVLVIIKLLPFYKQLQTFDAEAMGLYVNMLDKLITTGSIAEATVWKVPVQENLSFEEVENTIRSVASEYNVKSVGELSMYKQVEALTGERYRYVKTFMFCSALTAAKMLDYDDAYSAFLPCRITLLEDKHGKGWLYAQNMDMMIHGGRPLPQELAQEAGKFKQIIMEIMRRGAAGEF